MEAKLIKELQGKIFELTLALYRVTDFFPQGEPLRKHLRDKANEIFGAVSEYANSLQAEREAVFLLGKIETIKGYLGLAKSMRFVKPLNLTVLEREYTTIAGLIGEELEQQEKEDKNPAPRPVVVQREEKLTAWKDFTEKPKTMPKAEARVTHKPARSGDGANERQRKIVEYIRSVNQAKISDFFTFFEGLSTKTIQRDLQDLVGRNVLKKEGEKRWTIYTLNTSNVQ